MNKIEVDDDHIEPGEQPDKHLGPDQQAKPLMQVAGDDGGVAYHVERIICPVARI